MDTIAYIGMFLMVGVIVNNGIVIVITSTSCARAADRMQATLQGAGATGSAR